MTENSSYEERNVSWDAQRMVLVVTLGLQLSEVYECEHWGQTYSSLLTFTCIQFVPI